MTRLPRRLIVVATVLGVLALAGTAAAAIAARAYLRPAYERTGLLTFLVVGSDIGPPHRPGDLLHGNADAIHLVAVDPGGRRATIVDLPRDSWIAGSKVNAHLRAGGPGRLEAVLEDYSGIPIDFWAVTSFQGLENLVTELGGVDVVVDRAMKDAFSGSNFAPGPQRLNGPQALAFTRDRHSVPGGDIGRSRHQGDLLRFAHIQLRTHHSDLATLARLAGAFAANTVTNIPRNELLLLAELAVQIDPANVRQVALSGPTAMVDGASIVQLNPGDTFARIRQGHVGP